MSCDHPRQPNHLRKEELLPCAWPECPPASRIGPVYDGLSQNNGTFIYLEINGLIERVERRTLPAAGAQLRADSYWWAWGDEAEQALCGEAFDLAREKARLEAELVLRDQMEGHGKPKYLRVNASQLAALAAAEVKGVVALTEPISYRGRESHQVSHFPGLIEVSVLPADVADIAHRSELLGFLGGTNQATYRHSNLVEFNEQSNDQEHWEPIPHGQSPTMRFLRFRGPPYDNSRGPRGGQPVTPTPLIAHQDHPHAHGTNGPGTLLERVAWLNPDGAAARMTDMLGLRNPLLNPEPPLDVMEEALGERLVAFVDGWTVRRCIDCRRPIAGGPTRCTSCVDLEVLRLHEESAELGARESLLRRAAELEARDGDADGDGHRGADEPDVDGD